MLLKTLEDGWILEAEGLAPPYLRSPGGNRHTMQRDTEGVLQVHLSRSPLAFNLIQALKDAFDDWENGRPNAPLPEGWTWSRLREIVPGHPIGHVWAAINADREECYCDDQGYIEASGIPCEVVDTVLKVHKARGSHRVSALETPATSTEPPQSRHAAILEGIL